MVDVRFKLLPKHKGELEETIGATGVESTNTTTVPAALTQELSVAVTEYVPDATVVAAVIVGF
jgi:hypothetical protein